MQVISNRSSSSSLDLNEIDKFSDNDVFYIYETFTPTMLDRIFSKKGYPKYVVSDHYTEYEYPGIQKIYCLPLWTTKNFNKSAGFVDPTLPVTTDYIFNFSVNKKEVNRFLCLKMVELFKLKNYSYTHSGFNSSFDMTDIIAEMNQLGNACPILEEDKTILLSPSNIAPKFFTTDAPQLTEDNGIRLTVVGTSYQQLWQDYVEKIFINSAISLICESNFGSLLSEKTVYSVLGLTMPIWVGGHLEADYWKRIGFDIFDDIIDHSYQNYNTTIERCYYAFQKNIRLLSNFEETSAIRQEIMPRLIHNRNLLLDDQLIKYCKYELGSWPADLQAAMPAVLKYYTKIQPFIMTPDTINSNK